MHEHEVPTHVQAEDRVLLWFTFPQLIALAVAAALGYGVYHYAPVGPEPVRIMLGLGVALTGVALVAGKVRGRPLPAVLADLLKFGLGASRFAGPISQLARAEPPVPPAPPGVAQQPASKPKRRSRTRGERMPRAPLGWFRKRNQQRVRGQIDHARRTLAKSLRGQRFQRWSAGLGAAAVVAALSVVTCTPRGIVAQEPTAAPRLPEEIEFEPGPLIDGRRLYIERLVITPTEATVVLRAAADLEVDVRAFGGVQGRSLVASRSVALHEGERSTQRLPLSGAEPSFTFAWLDEHLEGGALTLSADQLPHPLPAVEGDLCDLQLTSLEWRPSQIRGAVSSVCVASIDEQVRLQTVAGHVNQTETVVLSSDVRSLSGALQVSVGSRQTSVPLVADGTTRFQLTLESGAGIQDVALSANVTAQLNIPLPDLVQLTYHPARTEAFSETVSFPIPDTEEVASQTVTFTVTHPAHVCAAMVARSPLTKSREERLTLTTVIASDDPYAALVAPERPPTASTQTRVPEDELSQLFAQLGWELN